MLEEAQRITRHLLEPSNEFVGVLRLTRSLLPPETHSIASEPLGAIELEAENSLEFLKEVFSLYERGKLFTIAREGIDLSQYSGLRILDRRATGKTRGWGHFSHRVTLHDQPAQIVFSSGTEGTPKAIVLSARALGDVVNRLHDVMQLDETIREYIGVPVTYSFGLGRARAVAAAGGSFFLPERFDPMQLRAMLAQDEINAISAVPSLWRILLAAPETLGDLGKKVRWIEIGSQYMTGEEKAAMRRLFPQARIVQHYGLTEASRSTFLAIDEADGKELESVGRPFGETEVCIGEDQEICIRGPHLASGVLQEDGGILPLTDADGWLHTSDKGELHDGCLFYLGRLDDQINISGIKLASENLEREISTLVSAPLNSFAIAPIPDSLRGDAILLALTPDAQPYAELLEAAAKHVLMKREVQQPGIIKSWMVDSLPTTGSGKVQRKQLRARWLDEVSFRVNVGEATAPESDLTPDEAEVVAIWRKIVGQTPIGPEDHFYDVGGDSLSALQVGLAMEEKFPRAAVQATLAGRNVREIAALKRNPRAFNQTKDRLPNRTIESWAINATRGVMVVSVLLSHWGPGLFGRVGASILDSWLAFVYRLGTPGFALVFGLGIGFFMLPGYPENKTSVHRRLLTSFVLVASGLTLMAFVELWLDALRSHEITSRFIAEAFYRVLSYYLLAIASAPLWLFILSKLEHPTAALLVAAMAFWVTWWGAQTVFQGPPLESLLEWSRLMVVANYSYFRVSSFVFLGIAVGFWLSLQSDLERSSRTLLLWGTFGAAVSVFIGFESYGANAIAFRSAPFFTSTIGAIFYLSVLFILLGASIKAIMAWHRMSMPLKFGMEFLILLGGLALPIYAFHAVVIPLRDIFAILGLPGAAALAMSLGGFLILLGYGLWRLRRMYFA